MLVTIFGCWWRKKHVDDIYGDVSENPIGHQHHKTQKYDVATDFECWWPLKYLGDIFSYVGASYGQYGQ